MQISVFVAGFLMQSSLKGQSCGVTQGIPICGVEATHARLEKMRRSLNSVTVGVIVVVIMMATIPGVVRVGVVLVVAKHVVTRA